MIAALGGEEAVIRRARDRYEDLVYECLLAPYVEPVVAAVEERLRRETVREVAAALSLNVRDVQYIRQRARRMRRGTLLHLASVLGVRLDDIRPRPLENDRCVRETMRDLLGWLQAARRDLGEDVRLALCEEVLALLPDLAAALPGGQPAEWREEPEAGEAFSLARQCAARCPESAASPAEWVRTAADWQALDDALGTDLRDGSLLIAALHYFKLDQPDDGDVRPGTGTPAAPPPPGAGAGRRGLRAVAAPALVVCPLLLLGGWVGVLHRETRHARQDVNRLRAEAEEAAAGRQKAEQELRQADLAVQKHRARVEDFRDLVAGLGAPEVQEARQEVEGRVQKALAAARDVTPDAEAACKEALAALGVGRLLIEQGRHAEAQSAMDQAAALTQTLKDVFPHHEKYRLAFVAAWSDCGNLYWTRMKLPEALACYQRALPEAKKLALAFPDNSDYANLCSRCRHNIGGVLASNGKYQEAAAVLRLVADDREELVRKHPRDRTYRKELAGTYWQLATSLHMQPAAPADIRSSAEAVAKYHRRALELQAALAGGPAAGPDDRHALHRTRSYLATAVAELGESKEATTAYDQAIDGQRSLVRDHPNAVMYRAELGRTLSMRGRLAYVEGDKQAARELVEEAVGHKQTVAALHRGNTRWMSEFEDDQKNLIAFSLELGRHHDAARVAKGFVCQQQWGRREYLYLAAVWASCKASAEKDEKAAAEHRQKWAQGYGDQAMAMIREAVARGTDAGSVKRHPRFAPLRSRPDFQQLGEKK